MGGTAPVTPQSPVGGASAWPVPVRLTGPARRPQERPVEVGDWRKNVEAMSGMEGRKKMFDAAKSPTSQ